MDSPRTSAIAAIAAASLAPAAPAIHVAATSPHGHSHVPATPSATTTTTATALPLKSSLKHHDPASSHAESATSSSSTLLNPLATPSSALAQFTDYGFVQRVSFDATLEAASRSGGGVGSELALTLIASTPGFKRSSESRTFLVACDLNAYSINALQWTMRALVENGDEVVVLRVFPPNAAPAAAPAASSAMSPSNSNSGTSGIPDDEELPSQGVSSITDTARDEAHALIASVMEQNSQAVPQRDISVTVEFVVGKVFATIHAMIAVYRPDSLIVGTKGRSDSLFKAAFIGSVSKWAVANATIPTIVVRTPDRIRKTKVKRAQRQSYKGLIGERVSAAEKKEKDIEQSSTGTNDSQQDHLDEQNIVREDVEEGNETEPVARKTGIPFTKSWSVDTKAKKTGIPFVKSASMDERGSSGSSTSKA